MDSYHQVTGNFAFWGDYSKQTPIKRKGLRLWELRFADGLTYIYLFFAAGINAGALGVNSNDKLLSVSCDGQYTYIVPTQTKAI